MDITAAAYAASTLSFIVWAGAAKWYAIPWLRQHGRATALTALLWIHALRYVALQIYSAQAAGFAVPDDIRDRIAYGDVFCAVLAFAAIVALRYRRAVGTLLAWLLSAVGIVDLISATAGGIRADLFGKAAGVTWLILTFYVPLLWVSHVLIIWQLLSRGTGPLLPTKSIEH